MRRGGPYGEPDGYRVSWPGRHLGENAMSFAHFVRAVLLITQAPQTDCRPLPSEPEAVENDYFRLARQPRD